MKPAVAFADPEACLVTHLQGSWEDRSEAFKPVKISTYYPSEPLKGDDTWVQVELEASNADGHPIVERAQVRVTCHAARGQRSHAKDLASVTQGLASTHPGDDDVAGVFIRGGRSGVITDPDTQNLMVWFLVRLDLIAAPLAP